MMTNNSRPLLQIVSAKQKNCLINLPYSYSQQDIKALASYLAPCLKIVGIDYQNSQDIVKNKYKYCGHLGKNVTNGEPFNFLDSQDLLFFTLPMDIVIPLPNDPTLGDLSTQLTNQVNKNLYLYKQGQSSSYTALQAKEYEQIKVQDLPNLKAIIRSSNYMHSSNKPVRVFSNFISIPIVLPKSVCVTMKLLKQMIIQDLCNTINIMAHNNMFQRVVKFHHGVVPIQNYFKLRQSEDRQFSYFVSDGHSSVNQVDEVLMGKVSVEKGNKCKEVANQAYALILGLVLMVIVYGYLKIKEVI